MSAKISLAFVVSLYTGLADFLPEAPTWETFLACLIFLDTLQEITGGSIVTDRMVIMFGFSTVFGC